MIWSANMICTFTVSFSFYTSSLLICSIFVRKWYNFPKIFNESGKSYQSCQIMDVCNFGALRAYAKRRSREYLFHIRKEK